MDSNLDEEHRRSIRLQNYDYRQPGLYFVTICTDGMKWAFGEIVDSEMRLSSEGQIVYETWSALPERFPDIELDQFVIMPNHLHGIISIVGEQFITSNDSYKSNVPDRFKKHMHARGWISQAPMLDASGNPQGAMNRTPTHDSHSDPRGAMNRAPTLGEIVRTFKAVASRRMRSQGMIDFRWQRNYYEHIIRKNDDLDRIRQYINNNPVRWTENDLYDEEASQS